MNKRQFLLTAGAVGTYALLRNVSWAGKQETVQLSPKATTIKDGKWGNTMSSQDERITLSDAEWKQRLNREQFRVLRKEGTERAGTSALNDEKRAGEYLCAGCGLLLFTSEMKYDSGTGWPSFYSAVDEHIGTKRDTKLFSVRTEYHCKRCGGHQGHVFDDGPKPTGKRFCNNGAALTFVATSNT